MGLNNQDLRSEKSRRNILDPSSLKTYIIFGTRIYGVGDKFSKSFTTCGTGGLIKKEKVIYQKYHR